MQVELIVVGALDENCYIIRKNNTCLVVDPGDDYNKIKEVIGKDKVLGVLITHSHFDHVGALRNFLNNRRIKIFKQSVSKEGVYEIGDFKFETIETPGHAKDELTFYFEDLHTMFIGDFIFKDSLGRVDLPGGSSEAMRESLIKIRKYPPDTILLPGHGEKTILGYEFERNPYIREML